MTEFKPDEIMLQNYIQNKLSPIETEQLELWLADHPDVMQELELDMMFSQSKQAFKQVEQPKQTKSFNIWDFFTSKKLFPVHALAYGLALFFVFNGLFNNSVNDNFSPATFIELEKVRGNETHVLEYNHPLENALTIRFFPDSASQIYKVIMNSESQSKKYVVENLKADNYGSITISLNNENKLNDKWEILVYDNTNQLEQNYTINLENLIRNE